MLPPSPQVFLAERAPEETQGDFKKYRWAKAPVGMRITHMCVCTRITHTHAQTPALLPFIHSISIEEFGCTPTKLQALNKLDFLVSKLTLDGKSLADAHI